MARKGKHVFISLVLTAAMVTGVCGCGDSSGTNKAADTIKEGDAADVKAGGSEGGADENTLAKLDSGKWLYNKDDDVYYQVGIQYCANPADTTYETLGVFVPGAYMDGTDNGDGTYTCTLNTENTVEGYSAANAPMVLPVNTPGYSAMEAPTDYSDVSDYTDAGFVYIYAGCRGRDQGAPAGVTDLKAAIRYVRYCSELIPGDEDKIFSFGMSGGGAQSALLGSTGDAPEYTEYLDAIGAVTGYSDAVLGSMCWCPITNLDTADEAYEWNMGATRSDLDGDTKAISDALSNAYAQYINKLGLKDEEGNVLTLEESDEGIYLSGSYYEYIKSEIERSLNNFLADTTWPYTPSASMEMGAPGGQEPNGNAPDGQKIDENSQSDDTSGGQDTAQGGQKPDGNAPSGQGMGPGGQKPDGNAPGGDAPSGQGQGMGPGGQKPDGNAPDGQGMGPGGQKPDGNAPDGQKPGNDAQNNDAQNNGAQNNDAAGMSQEEIYATDGINRNDTEKEADTATYENAAAYIAHLNEEAGTDWITYDEATNTATITSVEAFVTSQKNASKSVGAFDDLECTQGENTLFGYGDGQGAHFDSTMADILKELGSEYADSYASDLEKTDSVGNTVDKRLNMYTPLYYLCDYYEGNGTSTVAPYWRIRTGISQGDTALNTEVNLALALENAGADVDFETIWGQGHTEAERTGSPAENFITWVNECVADAK